MKYHLSEDGNPRPCSASKKPCPVGGDEAHYFTPEAAREAYETSMKAFSPPAPRVSEENYDEVMEAVFGPEANAVREVDLLAANPDVAERVGVGIFVVSVKRVSLRGEDLYAAVADDGGDWEADQANEWIQLSRSEAGALELADGMIMDWKRNWGLA